PTVGLPGVAGISHLASYRSGRGATADTGCASSLRAAAYALPRAMDRKKYSRRCTASGSALRGVQHFLKLALGPGPHDPFDHLASLEHHQGRNAGDAKLLGRLRV